MNRRDLIKAAGIASLSGLPALAEAAKLDAEIVRLKLRHTWTTTMSSSDYRDTVHVRYIRDGITGHGEGAPIVRYKESAESALKAVNAARDVILSSDPWKFSKLM